MNTQTIEKPACNAARKESYLIPSVNLRETKEAWLLEAELPGVNKSGVEITVEKNELTLTGRRSNGITGFDTVYRESREADYRRVFELDPSIDAARISAKMEQGILKLTLPKSESVKPRKIEIGE